jgi:heat-inducible transcriptional repressor
MDLSTRQTQILKAIIEEYIGTAEPVGSQVLEKKYTLGVSPATIRNEMAQLTDKGYLRQPHTSAGRIPTAKGLRFYVDHLMQEKKLSVADEVSAREQVWDSRFNFDKLMRQATLSLAARTKSLSIATTADGDVYYSGVANILEMPEFFDIDVTRTVLSLLDQESRLRNLFFERTYGDETVHVIFGQDLGWPYFEPVGVAFTRFDAGHNKSGTLGIIGPCRLNYSYILPTLRYYADLISQMSTNW